MKCQREGCNNELKTGKKFCSSLCSANRMTAKAMPVITSTGQEVPDDIRNLVTGLVGENSPDVLNMMEIILAEQSGDIVKVPALSKVRTVGDWVMSWNGKDDYRPTDALTYDTAKQMAKNGVVKFATKAKLAGALAPFRSQRTWRMWSVDEPLKEATTQAMDRIIFRMVSNAMDSMFVFGNSMQETVYANFTSFQLGMSKSRGAQTTWTMPKLPKQVDPETVDRIRRTGNFKFNGFVQKPTISGRGNNFGEIIVPVQNALVLVNEERFRNLWGESSYEAVYPFWFWYEVTIRAMVRYMERMGTPVTVVRAPSKKMVRKPGTTAELVDAMVWGLAVAANAGVTSALALPSDLDPDTQKPLWGIEYLSSQERSQPFIEVLEQLTQIILRSMVIADRAVSKDSGTTGSYAMAEVHSRANAVQNQMIVAGVVDALNEYFFPWIARFNRGDNYPPLRILTQGLDVQDINMITKLFGVSGNVSSAQDALGRIDYERMATDAGIAFLDEAQYKKKKEDLETESLKRQEDQLKMAKKHESPNVAKEPKQNVPNPAREEAKKEQQAYADLVELLGGEGGVPLIMSADDYEKYGIHVETGEPTTIELYNPFHDRKGRFAKGRGGRGGGGGGGGGGKKSPGAKFDPRSIAKGKGIASGISVLSLGNLAKVMGVAAGATAGIAAIGIAVNKLGQPKEHTIEYDGKEYLVTKDGRFIEVSPAVEEFVANGGSFDHPVIARARDENTAEKIVTPTIIDGKKSQAVSPEILAAIEEATIAEEGELPNLQDLSSSIPLIPVGPDTRDSFLDLMSIPEFKSEKEAAEWMIDKLAKVGLDPSADKQLPLNVLVASGGFLSLRGAGAAYSPSTNTIILPEGIHEEINNGSEYHVQALFHEGLHARQEKAGASVTIFVTGDKRKFIEGQNELMTQIVISDLSGKPYISGAYDDYVRNQAMVALAAEKNSGYDPIEYVKDSHDDVDNKARAFGWLKTAFPDQMEAYSKSSYPSQSTLYRWALEEGITYDALDDILERASQ